VLEFACVKLKNEFNRFNCDILTVLTLLNVRGKRIVKKVGCGYIEVSRSRELIVNNVVFLDSFASNFVPALGIFGGSSERRTAPPVDTGGNLPGTLSNDSSDVYPDESEPPSESSDTYGL
jgi:hypothetical protein